MSAGEVADPVTSTDLFYGDLIDSYTAALDWVTRGWLEQQILEQLSEPDCRYVLVAAEPGAGKTGIMAALAATHRDWLRYFIRRDSTTPLSGGDASSMLLRIGHQLAQLRPHLFEPGRLEIVVRQRVEEAGPEAQVVGVHIEDLAVSPFHRTAIRVEQHVGTLGAGMIGLDVAHATVEQRLLEPSVLQYLALLDPATVLAEEEPEALIVVLVDALDEVFGFRTGESALDWLENSPEIPANVRFILSSRPHGRLASLRGAWGDSVRPVDIVTNSNEVVTDVRTFAANLFEDLASQWPGDRDDPRIAVDGLSRVADGNFAYLNAYARGLRGAAAEGNDDRLRALLEFDALPRGLAPLYAYFLRRLRQEIGALGDLEVRDATAGGSAFVPAWEGVGQRFLGVLAVAKAPLSVDQLVAFGSVRVWRREAGNVLERFLPFLDSVDGGYRLFHASLAEFLTAEPDRGEGISVDTAEWHLRIVRHCLGAAAAWSMVDWAHADDYALLHLAEHMVELGADGPGRVTDLVNPRLREAALDRFLTDLPFRRIIDTALAEARESLDPAEALISATFLSLVRKELLAAGSRLDPPVLGLMARLGRTREALARCELIGPSHHRFRCLEAVTASVPEADHLLGPHNGADGLVAAALEIPNTTPGMAVERKRCLGAASVALAPYDPERAVGLAALAELDDTSRYQDDALLAAAQSAPPAHVRALIDRMVGRKAVAAARAAERVPPGALRDELLGLAHEHLDSDQPAERIKTLTRLARLGGETGNAALAALRAATVTDDDEKPSRELRQAWLDAANDIRSIDPLTAEALLDAVTVDRDEGNAHVDSRELLEAARLFAGWGEEQRSRELVNKVLGCERLHGANGVDIAKAASVVHAFDPSWASELSDEAVALVEPVLNSAERLLLQSTLSFMVSAFIPWDLERALRVARWMTGSWSNGENWQSISGRSSALGMIGLKLIDSDRGMAGELLAECLADERAPVVIGRSEAVVRGGPFAPAGEAAPDSAFRTVTLIASVQNSISSWVSARDWRFFTSPIQVLRAMAPPPGGQGSSASWAGAVAAATGMIARELPETALDLVARIIEPSERVLALARVADAFDAAGDERARPVVAELAREAATLPVYVNEIDFDAVTGPVLTYLNPSARARLEAALLLPGSAAATADALATAAGSPYLGVTYESEAQWRRLVAPIPDEMSDADIETGVQALVEQLEQHPDDIQADLIRSAAALALASRGLPRAGEIIEAIARPWTRALAEIYALAASAPTGQSLGDSFLSVLNDLPHEANALHRASLAAHAMLLLPPDDSEAIANVREWGARSVRETDPLLALHGLAMLARASQGPDKAALIAEASAHGDNVSDVALRVDALADTFGPAVGTRDPALIVRTVQQLLDAHWQVLVEGFRRGAAELIDAFGAEIIDELDSAMRQAQDVLNQDQPGEHFDGVLPPGSPHTLPIPLDDPLSTDPAQFYALYLEQPDLSDSLSRRQHEMVLSAMQAVIDRSDDDPSERYQVTLALLNKGVTLSELGRSDEALAAYDEVVRRVEADRTPAAREQLAVALGNKGTTLGRLGRSDEALAAYDEVVGRFEADPTPAVRAQLAGALVNKGWILEELGRLDEALAVYDEVVGRFEADPTPAVRAQLARALVNKGVVLWRLGRPDDELAVYDEVVGRYEADQTPAVREQLARALFNKGMAAWRLGRPDEALAVYDEMVGRFQTDQTPAVREQVAMALVNKGASLGALGHPDDELAAYDEAVGRFEGDRTPAVRAEVARALANKAGTLAQLGRSDDALAAYNELVGRFETDQTPAVRKQVASALANTGATLSGLGRPGEALAVYDEVVGRFEADETPAVREQVAKALGDKGLTLWDMGRSDEALAVYDEVVGRFGADETPAVREWVASALANKAGTLGRLGRPGDALAAYNELVGRFEADQTPAVREQLASALINKGAALGELGRPDEALAAYDKVMRRFEADQTPAVRHQIATAMVKKGLVLWELGRDDEVLAVYDELLRCYGEDLEPALREHVASLLGNNREQ